MAGKHGKAARPTSLARRIALLLPWAAAAIALPSQPAFAATSGVDTQDFPVKAFDALVVAVPAAVRSGPGKVASVKITAEPKVLAIMSVTQSGKQVKITTKGSFQTQSPVTVTVTTTSLTSLSVSDAGDVAVAGPLGTELVLKAQDASTVSLSGMNLKTLNADLSGSAEIMASGQSGKLQLKAGDASSFDGSSLALKHAKMAVSGASEATVDASTTLSVKISETGSVFYSGSPSIEQSVSFAGTLEAQ